MSLSRSPQLILTGKLAGRYRSSLQTARPERVERTPWCAVQAADTNAGSTEPSYPDTINLHDMHSLSDQDFIDTAYRAVLKRPADPEGMRNYLEVLEAGASRGSVLARLRYSPEGRLHATRVQGLGPRAAYYRLRSRLANALARNSKGSHGR